MKASREEKKTKGEGIWEKRAKYEGKYKRGKI
jgi:hypothetical protein